MKQAHAEAKGCALEEQLDPRIRRTRKLLQDALRSLIQERGYTKISVQDITERATVNRATFYAHYLDKDDLATSSLKADFHASLARRFTERPTLTRTSLLNLALGTFSFIGSLHDTCPAAAAALHDAASAAISETLFDIIEDCLKHDGGGVRAFPNISVETAANVITWSICGSALRWSKTRERPDASTMCGEIVKMLLPNSV